LVQRYIQKKEMSYPNKEEKINLADKYNELKIKLQEDNNLVINHLINMEITIGKQKEEIEEYKKFFKILDKLIKNIQDEQR